MPWKKDLAKLKQELVKEDPTPTKAPPPKAAPKPPINQSIEEEDALFLNAMGLRPQAKPRETSPAPVPEPSPAPLVRVEPAGTAQAPEEFNSAMGDLKGMKPLRRNPVQSQAKPAATAPTPAPVAVAVPVPEPVLEPEPEPPTPPSKAETGQPGAVEMHLAAGMAIEVDGSLDLRGHACSDGEERLKERLLDGYALGWRTLHVNLGPDPDLRDMLLTLLRDPAGRCVARYARAPIPMGGPQAWVLYFRANTGVSGDPA